MVETVQSDTLVTLGDRAEAMRSAVRKHLRNLLEDEWLHLDEALSELVYDASWMPKREQYDDNSCEPHAARIMRSFLTLAYGWPVYTESKVTAGQHCACLPAEDGEAKRFRLIPANGAEIIGPIYIALECMDAGARVVLRPSLDNVIIGFEPAERHEALSSREP